MLPRSQNLSEGSLKRVRHFHDRKNNDKYQKTLAYFDSNARTQVIADAGPVELGTVLVQEERGEMCVISYARLACQV